MRVDPEAWRKLTAEGRQNPMEGHSKFQAPYVRVEGWGLRVDLWRTDDSYLDVEVKPCMKRN